MEPSTSLVVTLIHGHPVEYFQSISPIYRSSTNPVIFSYIRSVFLLHFKRLEILYHKWNRNLKRETILLRIIILEKFTENSKIVVDCNVECFVSFKMTMKYKRSSVKMNRCKKLGNETVKAHSTILHYFLSLLSSRWNVDEIDGRSADEKSRTHSTKKFDRFGSCAARVRCQFIGTARAVNAGRRSEIMFDKRDREISAHNAWQALRTNQGHRASVLHLSQWNRAYRWSR